MFNYFYQKNNYNIFLIYINMTFNVLEATSPSSIEQIFNSYNSFWGGYYYMVDVINLWYYTNS
jgi:hypothetical protein